MRWQDQTEAPALPSAAAFLTRLGVLDSVRLTQRGNTSPRVVITADCLEAISFHLAKARTEMGGLLLGRAYAGLNGQADAQILVAARSVPSQAFDSTNVSLRMEAEVWTAARPFLDKGDIVLGWYHSHPDLGAFFSDTDRTTQRAFFRQPYSLGIVIDPVRQEMKAYLGPDSAPIPAENVMVYEGHP
ncbi:MAG: Mov34/MPN/PAD-1 family protein [Rhodospirillaceae bacterium]|nr:Mov34/MPN/PAD-1 family protein [Rhodospirillaceae bacterium]